MSQGPYGSYLDGVDPLVSLERTPERIASLVTGWPADAFERSYATGKWNARQLLIHLAHTEMAFGHRARLALTTPQYVVTPFDQDDWIAREGPADAQVALAAYRGMRWLNLLFFRGLSRSDRATRFHHPERGEITVDWVIATLAGHERHHLQHLEAIARLHGSRADMPPAVD